MKRFVPLFLILASACTDAALLGAARSGDEAVLGDLLAKADARGHLRLGAVAEVAEVVLARELRDAKTPAEARARLAETRSCARAIDDLLADRMKEGDPLAADAAFERAEAGSLSDSAARALARGPGDTWRAVVMWGMTRAQDHDARLQGLTDGSPLVRRAALHATAERGDPADWGAVYEVARLDPEPLLRSTAVRMLGRIAPPPTDAVNRMRDLWTTADAPLREDIAAALVSRPLEPVGGREAVAHLLAVTQGNEAVSVSGVVLGANVADPGLQATATRTLAAAIADGDRRTRIHAIVVAPIDRDPTLRAAVEVASKADDVDVQVAALGRLAGSRVVPDTARPSAIARLEAMAAPRSPSSARAPRVLGILADARDLRVQAWIEAELRSTDEAIRLEAAEGLVSLGRASRAAPLLADASPDVRARAACVVLRAARDDR